MLMINALPEANDNRPLVAFDSDGRDKLRTSLSLGSYVVRLGDIGKLLDFLRELTAGLVGTKARVRQPGP
jgi:hypothetical protein